MCSKVFSRPPKEAEVHSAAPEIVAPPDFQNLPLCSSLLLCSDFADSPLVPGAPVSLGAPDVAMELSCCSGSSCSLYCTDLWARLSPWGPQAACSLQVTEGTTTERKRAKSCERDSKRVRVPAPWGAAELSVVTAQQVFDKGCCGRADKVRGMMSPCW